MRILTLFPEGFMERKYLGHSMRFWTPILTIVLIVGGLCSPLFNLNDIHGVHNPLLYFQHFYLDACAGLGGYWAATMCSHAWHRVLVMMGIDILVTFLLVTIIG